jgi:hypothetical protein
VPACSSPAAPVQLRRIERGAADSTRPISEAGVEAKAEAMLADRVDSRSGGVRRETSHAPSSHHQRSVASNPWLATAAPKRTTSISKRKEAVAATHKGSRHRSSLYIKQSAKCCVTRRDQKSVECAGCLPSPSPGRSGDSATSLALDWPRPRGRCALVCRVPTNEEVGISSQNGMQHLLTGQLPHLSP